MSKDTRLSIKNRMIHTLYNRYDDMVDDSSKVVVLQPKMSPSTYAIMEDVQSMLENPATRRYLERRLKDMLSEVAMEIIHAR